MDYYRSAFSWAWRVRATPTTRMLSPESTFGQQQPRSIPRKCPPYDNAGLHRFKDPGVGAFTVPKYQIPVRHATYCWGGEYQVFTANSWFTTRLQLFDGTSSLLNDYYPEEVLRKMTDMKSCWSGARKTHKDTDNFLVTVGRCSRTG
jgi:hypothetical protein